MTDTENEKKSEIFRDQPFYITVRHFCSRKRNIRSVGQFLEMKEADRRNVLRNLTDMQYQDVVTVAGNYPFIDMDVNGIQVDMFGRRICES